MANDRCLIEYGITPEERQEIFGDLDPSSPEALQRLEPRIRAAQNMKRGAKLQAVRMSKNESIISSGVVDGRGADAALESILVQDVKGRKNVDISMDRRIESIVTQTHAMISDFMEKYRPRRLGMKYDDSALDNLVKERFGQKTGDVDAVALNKKLDDVFEYVRQRFNKAGGATAHLDNYFPQSHDALKVRGMTKDEWVSFIEPLLDRQKIRGKDGDLLDEKEFKRLLQESYDSITTEGLKKMKPGKLGSMSAYMGNKHIENRVLHFKDGESWLAYNKKFGKANAYQSVTSYLHEMSTQIGAMETFGPNPDKAIESLINKVRQESGNPRAGAMAKKMYANIMNYNNHADNTLGQVAATTRNVLSAVHLGGAMLSAISDTAFLGITANYNGIPVVKTLGRLFSSLNPMNAADKEFAAQMAMGADYAIDRAIAANRYTESVGYGASARVSDFVMRAQGLNAWTIAGKQAFAMEFNADMARNLGKSFDSLDPKKLDMFGRYGITAADWDSISAASTKSRRGVPMLDAMSIKDPIARDRYIGMMLSERSYAVPEPDARVRTYLNQGTNAGTWEGEAWRSVTQFKSFPVTVITTHLARAMFQDGRIKPKLGYIASMVTGLTVLGALSIQAKEFTKGREPIPWDSQELWTRGFMNGGSAGMIGDVLFNDVTRYGSSLGGQLAGPGISAFDDVVRKFLVGNAHEVIFGDKDISEDLANMGGDATQLLKSYAPGASLWYTRLAMERYIFDQVQQLTDPSWHAKLSRNEATLREKDRSFWWQPGETTPQ